MLFGTGNPVKDEYRIRKNVYVDEYVDAHVDWA